MKLKLLVYAACISAFLFCQFHTYAQISNEAAHAAAVAALEKSKKMSVSCDCDFTGGAIKEPMLKFRKLISRKNRYSYNANELTEGKRLFKATYKYRNNSTDLDDADDSVLVSQLCLRLDEIRNNTHYGNGDLSALRMYFGMKDNKIVLIYETVILHPNPNFKKQFDEETSGIFWTADNKGSMAMLADTNGLIRGLRADTSNIFINHISPSGNPKFIEGDDFSTCDVRHCTMSFQQLFKMYKENNSGTCVANSHLIKFNIIANDYFENSGSNYKMHIVASYNIGVGPMYRRSYNALGADFSQMSPPKNGYVEEPTFAKMRIVKKKLEANKATTQNN